MIIIGLTGSIGMGKSTTSDMFRSLGVPVISADEIVHDLYSSEAAPLIEAAFPGTTTDGVVDRQALSAKLMAAPEGFARLEAIIHPLVRAREKQFVDEAAERGEPMVLLDIPAAFRNRVDRPRRHCHCRQLCAGDPAPESHGKTGHDRGEIRGHSGKTDPGRRKTRAGGLRDRHRTGAGRSPGTGERYRCRAYGFKQARVKTMREIIFDTETTGLENQADRIIEIGCIELENQFPTGRTLHLFINPDGRKVHPDALAVHGITDAFLADKPALCRCGRGNRLLF
jgi:hypothetical protein